MRTHQLLALLGDAGIPVASTTPNSGGYIPLKCPFASDTHERGTDGSPSFFIKVGDEPSHYHCFSGETRFLTQGGDKTFEETQGTVQKVLSPTGEWVDARIRNFGDQPLYRLKLSRNGYQKDILTTARHRWFAKHQGGGLYKEKITTELKTGDRLQATLPLREITFPDPVGVVHGIVFGDGFRVKSNPREGGIRLFGGKMPLSAYFEATGFGRSITHVDGDRYAGTAEHVRVLGPFGSFKDLPSLDAHEEYLLGFIAGYLATDGGVYPNNVTLSSSVKENLQWVRDAGNKVGVGTYHIGSTTRKGYGSEDTDVFSVNLVRSTLPACMLVREDQRKSFYESTKPAYERLGWQVVGVEATGRVAPVYCAQVPEHGAFVLEDYITTGNCFTCKENGSHLSKMFRRLEYLTGEKYMPFAIRADLEEIPDRFATFEEGESVEPTQRRQPVNEAIFEGLFCDPWEVEAAAWYLRGREVTPEASATMGLLYDERECRILFPVRDRKGLLYGFSGRTILDPKEYPVFPSGRPYSSHRDYNFKKQLCLLGEHLHQPGKPVVLVEGMFAYAHLVSIGAREWCNPMATLGSVVSPQQKDLLLDMAGAVYLLYDLDEAGNDGVERAVRLLAKDLPTFVCLYPAEVSDPDKLTAKQFHSMLVSDCELVG